jgi:hypothetical protein
LQLKGSKVEGEKLKKADLLGKILRICLLNIW